MVYLDTTTAQARLLGKPASFSAVTVDAAPGTSDTDLRQHLQAVLGQGYAIAIKEEQAQSCAAQISAFLNADSKFAVFRSCKEGRPPGNRHR